MKKICRRDCAFFIGKSKHCSALISTDCADCGFFKTPTQLIAGREKATRRLNSLADGQEIISKYYGVYNTTMRKEMKRGVKE